MFSKFEFHAFLTVRYCCKVDVFRSYAVDTIARGALHHCREVPGY